MSLELANEKKALLGQVASNKGYMDLINAVEKLEKTPTNMPLIVFIDRGYTDAVSGCIAALKALAKADGTDADVAKTAKGMARLMDGQAFIIVTNGGG